jgi:hypothetical protein
MCQLVDVDEVFMLKTTLKVHNNLDISKYGKLKAYLKSQSTYEYKSKKGQGAGERAHRGIFTKRIKQRTLNDKGNQVLEMQLIK